MQAELIAVVWRSTVFALVIYAGVKVIVQVANEYKRAR